MWRWTSANHVILPPDILEKIHYFSQDAMPAIFEEDKKRIVVVRNEPLVIIDSNDDSNAGEERISQELQKLGIAAQTTVILSWSEDCAVQTSWEIFVTYWSDFCYPGSDDVTIWSLGQPWTLLYFHYEEFCYWPDAEAHAV